ncbi:hypothetical protein COOONC_05962 [Cooperia oncophora]
MFFCLGGPASEESSDSDESSSICSSRSLDTESHSARAIKGRHDAGRHQRKPRGKRKKKKHKKPRKPVKEKPKKEQSASTSSSNDDDTIKDVVSNWGKEMPYIKGEGKTLKLKKRRNPVDVLPLAPEDYPEFDSSLEQETQKLEDEDINKNPEGPAEKCRDYVEKRDIRKEALGAVQAHKEKSAQSPRVSREKKEKSDPEDKQVESAYLDPMLREKLRPEELEVRRPLRRLKLPKKPPQEQLAAPFEDRFLLLPKLPKKPMQEQLAAPMEGVPLHGSKLPKKLSKEQLNAPVEDFYDVKHPRRRHSSKGMLWMGVQQPYSKEKVQFPAINKVVPSREQKKFDCEQREKGYDGEKRQVKAGVPVEDKQQMLKLRKRESQKGADLEPKLELERRKVSHNRMEINAQVNPLFKMDGRKNVIIQRRSSSHGGFFQTPVANKIKPEEGVRAVGVVPAKLQGNKAVGTNGNVQNALNWPVKNEPPLKKPCNLDIHVNTDEERSAP